MTEEIKQESVVLGKLIHVETTERIDPLNPPHPLYFKIDGKTYVVTVTINHPHEGGYIVNPHREVDSPDLSEDTKIYDAKLFKPQP